MDKNSTLSMCLYTFLEVVVSCNVIEYSISLFSLISAYCCKVLICYSFIVKSQKEKHSYLNMQFDVFYTEF